ncbi:peptidase domain-containing ABC transporter [Paenibacillus fonticola]|uniref:peptidase domain-containing ABC transporter n=1 Tax=Paenibacillus fonticola TaxID=379896 RepID=UPI0009FEFA07|nr:peptidase domain-containing ABC transporter [Paenibacillus fonticola]
MLIGGGIIFKKKVPYVEQMDKMDCGICCLAMISAYHGKHVSLLELREFTGHGRDGISLLNLKKLAELLGFDTICQKLNLQQLNNDQLPLIIFWDEKHFVVLEKIYKNKYFVVDPEHGRRIFNEDEFSLKFSKYVLKCIPTKRLILKKQVSSWIPIIKLLFKTPRILLSLLATSIILQLISLAVPFFTKLIIDNVIISEASSKMYIYGLGIVILFFSLGIITLTRGKLVIFLQNLLDTQLTTDFFKHLLKLPYNFFQLRSFGDLLFRANSLQTIRELLSNYIFKCVLDIGVVVTILIYMFYQSTPLALWTIILGGLNIVFMIFSNYKIVERSKEEIVRSSIVSGTQTEMLYGISDIKLSGVEDIFLKKWCEEFNKLITSRRKKLELINYVNSISISITIFAPLLILFIGSKLVIANQLSLGSLIAFNTLTIQFFTLTSSLVQISNMFGQVKVHVNRIQDVMNSPIPHESNNLKEINKFKGEIKLENVCFKYSKYGENVIDNVSLHIQSGQKVAIVGKSGSGKSTLAGLLTGLYFPTEGTIKYDGVLLEELSKHQLRTNIGVVSQNVNLFNRSIFENISIHRPDASFEEVVEAAKIAQIHEEIMLMPMHYHTQISEMGMALSGGQRQRLAIARAILHKPRILLLDEATSSLDYINEQKIDAYFSSIQCTRVVITHRLTSILNADQILVIENGRIVCQGTHYQLISNNNYYKNYFYDNVQGEVLTTY